MASAAPPLSPSGPLGRPRKQRGKRTLASLLRERGVLSTAHAVEVALAICEALSTAHANGIVHGQLGLGCVRLAYAPDKGPREVEIFTLFADADADADLDDSGAVQTPPFRVPEAQPDAQADRPNGPRRGVDMRSDVWALGALLYSALVGSAPPPGDVVAPPNSMPLSLAAVVEACLAVDPDRRPQTVDDIAEKLASFATWPPDHFARLAARRDRRLAAERVQKQLERRGLGNMPNVLDKLDDAALARAQRNDTTAIASVLHGKSTEAALERLMTAVYEGTDAARVELASALPALVDFDDDVDDDVELLPPRAPEDAEPLEPVVFPLATAPATLAAHTPLLSSPTHAHAHAHTLLAQAAAPPSAPAPQRSAARVVATFSLAALAICLVAGSVGYALSAKASSALPPLPPAAAHAAEGPRPAEAPRAAEGPRPAEAPVAAAPARAAIPVFAPSALPEAPAITPQSLPEAKR